MQLDLHRKWLKKGYSIGILSIDGKRFCESVEDEDRGLKQTDSLETIKAKKVKGKTAIPVGTYEIKITYSPRFKKYLPCLLMFQDLKEYAYIRAMMQMIQRAV